MRRRGGGLWLYLGSENSFAIADHLARTRAERVADRLHSDLGTGWIGGVSGDLIGACGETVELLALIIMAF